MVATQYSAHAYVRKVSEIQIQTRLKFIYLLILFLIYFLQFLKEILFIYFWIEGKGGRKRETLMCGCLSRAPHQGPDL